MCFNIVSEKKTLVFVCLLAGFTAISACIAEDFNGDAEAFIDDQNHFIRGNTGALLSMGNFQFASSASSGAAFSYAIGYGAAKYPFFGDGREMRPGLFGDRKRIYNADGDRLRSLMAGVEMHGVSRMTFGIAGGIAVPRKNGAQTVDNHHGTVQGYYRLLDERFTVFGLLAGLEYGFHGGDSRLTIAVSQITGSDTASFSGTANSVWNLHALRAGLVIHKMFILSVINFYSRLSYSRILGDVKTNINGMLHNQAIDLMHTDSRGSNSAVLVAGMEIVAGPYRLVMEWGRDWIASPLMAACFIRVAP